MNNFFSGWEGHFSQYRPYLISFAFRMTGSLSEAEDIVQDTFLQCGNIDATEITNHKSWLTKVCANKALDHLKSAYKKRETYPGVWLPDALPDGYQYLEEDLLLSESVTTTFLLLVEKMTPDERVTYLLNEVFEYSYKEIAELLGKSEGAARKTAERARNAIQSQTIKYSTDRKKSEEVIAKFFYAARMGDKDSLFELLSDESELWADGGGKVPVVSSQVVDVREIISEYFSKLGVSKAFHDGEYRQEFHIVNKRPGIVISKMQASGEWGFDTILAFEVKDGKVARIYAQRNPDKFKKLVAK